MIEISVEADIKNAIRYLDDVQLRQVPFAMAKALNGMAFKMKQDTEHEIRDSFDRPTPWIQKSVRYTKATKSDLSLTFGFDVWGNKAGVTAGMVLRAEIFGGERKLKRFEVALRRKGILPAGMFAVPGAAAADLGMIDAYGNMKGSAIVQILSKLEAFQEGIGFNANVTARKRKRAPGRDRVYWAGKPGRNTPLGVWLIDEKYSKRGRLRPVLVFVDGANYEKRFDFFYAARKSAERHFPFEMDNALKGALATAK